MLHLAWGRRRWKRYLGEGRMGIEEIGGGGSVMSPEPLAGLPCI